MTSRNGLWRPYNSVNSCISQMCGTKHHLMSTDNGEITTVKCLCRVKYACLFCSFSSFLLPLPVLPSWLTNICNYVSMVINIQLWNKIFARPLVKPPPCMLHPTLTPQVGGTHWGTQPPACCMVLLARTSACPWLQWQCHRERVWTLQWSP